MVNDKIQFDLGGADLDDGKYKSYFARSMAVNSQYRENKCISLGMGMANINGNGNGQLQTAEIHKAIGNGNGNFSVKETNNLHHPATCSSSSSSTEPPEVVRLRKDLRNQNWNNNNNGNGIGSNSSSNSSSNNSASNASSRRTSLCSNIRIQENSSPVENFFLQSQINTLQWQLKETESSREMYRAVMRQVVTFLERAHRSLGLLGSRINNKSRLSRPQSEYFINTNSTDTLIDTSEVPWNWKKKQEPPSDEIPPEKLSQEAYRLLRTAQSLLSTHEPDLAHVTSSNMEEDLNFLSQLAKEFPAQDTKLPQRATSFSLCPKLLTPEKEKEKDKLSTTLNRKLSLQLSETVRRNSFLREVSKLNRSNESSRSSVIDHCEIFSSTAIIEDKVFKAFKYEKSSSPPVSSVGSAEDESGFSSMNSFQEVGIPHVESIDKTRTLHDENFQHFADDIKLWQTPSVNILHKRWSSTPVDNVVVNEKAPVLWV